MAEQKGMGSNPSQGNRPHSPSHQHSGQFSEKRQKSKNIDLFVKFEIEKNDIISINCGMLCYVIFDMCLLLL